MSEETEHEKQIALDLLEGIVTPEVLDIIEAALGGNVSKEQIHIATMLLQESAVGDLVITLIPGTTNQNFWSFKTVHGKPPCQRCGDSGYIPTLAGFHGDVVTDMSCPDCQEV